MHACTLFRTLMLLSVGCKMNFVVVLVITLIAFVSSSMVIFGNQVVHARSLTAHVR